MTNTVLIKRSGVANSVPGAGNLIAGELALNYADGNLFYKNSSNVVTVIASNQFLSVTGNVTGNYIIGNGAFLTGIATTSNQLTSTVDNFTGNGSTTFGLTVTPGSINLTWINIDGVEQIRTVYTLVGNVVTFSSPPATGANIEITTLSGAVVAPSNSISSGNSNVNIESANSNIAVGVNGISNVVVWATTGEYVTGLISATGNITGGNILAGSGIISTTGNISCLLYTSDAADE